MSFYHPSRMIPLNAIQVGSGKTDTTGSATITFPTPFPFPPKVFLQGVDAYTRGIVLDVYDVTTTGFKVRARKVTGLSATTSPVGDHTHSNPSTGLAGDHSHRVAHIHAVSSMPTPSTVYYAAWRDGLEQYIADVLFRNPPSEGYYRSDYTGSHSHTVGPTGSAGAHAHTVSMDSPTLSVDFFWLAVAL